MPRVKQALKEPPLFDRLPLHDLAAALHVSTRAVHKWCEAGAPRNGDGTFCLYDVHAWLLKESGGAHAGEGQAALETEKLRQQIRKLEIENEKSEEKYMLRSDHEAICQSRGNSLRNFLERGIAKSRPARAMRPVEELVSLDFELGKQMMEAFTGERG